MAYATKSPDRKIPGPVLRTRARTVRQTRYVILARGKRMGIADRPTDFGSSCQLVRTKRLHGNRAIDILSLNPGGSVIVSFGDRATEDLYHNRPTNRVRRFPADVLALALVKLDMLNAAAALLDLRSPPGNRLEALKGGLKGFHSIRVNDQWRLVFRWERNNAHEMKLIDYHS